MYDNNVVFFNEDFSKAKKEAKKYILELSKRGKKIVLLDSFWSKEKYSRFIASPYRENIEKRYHIKLSVEDFLSEDNLIEYMNERKVNIIKVKSIIGFMSASELFPVIVSKLDTINTKESIHVLLNDYILENIELKEIINVLNSLDKSKIKFIILSSKQEMIKELDANVSII
ncbi:MAG: hypothetical protein ACTHVE_02265 [Senegalia sp. (in: firmicutes)]|uniref:hypothetical protein n=1 Tax=Senegalia sp. (in: firmicutes) TaxID=1924098 RepID=UPI003F99954E